MEQKHFFPFRHFPMYFRNFKKDAKPDGIRKVHFLKSEWESFEVENRVSVGYLVYRVIFMICFMAVLSFDLSCWATLPPHYLIYYSIYMTNWSLVFATLYAIVFCGRVVAARCSFREKVHPDPIFDKTLELEAESATRSAAAQELGSETPEPQPPTAQYMEQKKTLRRHFFKPNSLGHLDRGIWLSFEMVFILAQVVTLGYWAFLFKERKPGAKECANHNFYFTHGLNCVLLTIDFFIVAIPVRLFHALYTFLFGVIYISFSGIYEVAGGSYPDEKEGQPYIYNFLNWRQKAEYVVIVPFAGIFLLTILHLLMIFLFSLRLLIVSKARPKLKVYHEHFYDYKKGEDDEITENNNLPAVELQDQNPTEPAVGEDGERNEP